MMSSKCIFWNMNDLPNRIKKKHLRTDFMDTGHSLVCLFVLHSTLIFIFYQ